MRLLLLFLLVAFSSAAQAQQITGVVKDEQGTPITGATVSLQKAADSTVVKLALTKEKGIYTFAEIREGNYLVSVTHIGYEPEKSVITVGSGSHTVPELSLKKAAANMQGIVVTARKPLIEVKADKTIMNVEGTINETGNDALELLRRSPGVAVDKDDNLSLAGKNGVQVYIDNRPSPLSGQDLANYLKTLQSTQVEAIEIISNPGAKYEAAGNAGIINIRLKKNKAFGTNGSLSAGWNVGSHSRFTGGLNLNYRNKNINIYGSLGAFKGKMEQRTDFRRTVLDTLFVQDGSMLIKMQNYNFKIGADYTINKTSAIGMIVNGILADPELNSSNKTSIVYEPTNTVDRLLVASNRSQLKRDNLNFNVNYNYNGKGGRSLLINADKGFYKNNNNQYQPNSYFDPTGQNMTRSVIYEMHSPTEIDIHSVKADYEQDFHKGKLGIGGKMAFITTDNDFQRFDVFTTGKELDKDRSNRFRYEENINAGYINYNRPFKGFMIQAGLRIENTVTEGTSTGLKKDGSSYVPVTSNFKRNYTDFFPSAAVTFNKNPMNSWTINYSRRIDRPNYADLNPFELKMDEYTMMKGNTDLKPQYTNTVGISNSYKYKLNTTLNYSHVADLFTQVLDTVEKSKAFNSKRNLASQDIVSLNVSYPFIYKSLTVFGNMNTFYSMYNADFGNGRKIDLNAFGLNLMTQASLKFAKTWTAELVGFYNAPSVYQGTFKAKSLWSVDAGMSKQVLKGKGTIKASFSDVFHSLKFRGTSDFAGQHINVASRWESQQFRLNFSFRFGKATVKAAKQKSSGAEEELKRAQQENNGGIGVGK